MGKKKKISVNVESETIKQGSIAEFMRKRTQLVGFDFGLNKHTQYAIEFLDNSLDAIESFQWKLSREAVEFAFELRDDLLLENFSYLRGGVTEEDVLRFDQAQEASIVDDEGIELSEDGSIVVENKEEGGVLIVDKKIKETKTQKKEKEKVIEEDEEARELRKLRKQAEDLEQEVQDIMWGLDGFLFPIKALVDREPFVLIQLTEREAAEVYTDINKKNQEIYEYNFEIFDNGSGMPPLDLEKFGKYLASSKSHKLKQTRGSQGFGSPSAFSDAQNTTGKPIKVVSKNYNHLYGMCSEFYTTSKNNKEYLVPPTEVDCFFEHGTYVELHYLNVKYKRGYIDKYIEQTALTNPHVTLIYLDPIGNEKIYPRRVKRFPREPIYALPHPSSVNIGDFQDLLRSSQNLTVSAFLQDNFVRISSSLAHDILDQTQSHLESNLGLLNLDHGFISWIKNPAPIYYMRYEKKVFGRSKKLRDKLITYILDSESDKNNYYEMLKPINKNYNQILSNNKKIRKFQKDLIKISEKKKIKELKKKLNNLEKEIKFGKNQINKQKKELSKTVKGFSFTSEITNIKIKDKMLDAVNELQISKARPNLLTQHQLESLYLIFKAQKFMAPPNEPAVPIGASVLETTLLKEFRLNPSHRTDLFADYSKKINKLLKTEEKSFTERILTKFKKEPYYDPSFNINNIYLSDKNMGEKEYEGIFQRFDVIHTQDDDFIYGHTRPPTSGKGLAFVVEAAIAISPKISAAKKAQSILMRYVNRTPKMRDNADCAIWKAVQSVNWKSYKLDTFENKIPRGNIRILVNVSGPYVHLMFKSQAKNALAEDEVLMKEIKMCLEVIGRKIRVYENRRIKRLDSKRRSKTIEKYIPIFVNSLLNIVHSIDDYESVTSEMLQLKLSERLDGKLKGTPEDSTKELKQQENQLMMEAEFLKAKEKAELLSKKPVEEVIIKKNMKLENFTKEPSRKIEKTIRSSSLKPKLVKSVDERIKIISERTSQPKSNSLDKKKPDVSKVSIQKKTFRAKKKPLSREKTQKVEISTKQTPKPSQPQKLIKPTSKINIISKTRILSKCPDNWFNIKDMIKRLGITDLKDARYLQIKLKQLTRDKTLLITIKAGKTFWKKNVKV